MKAIFYFSILIVVLFTNFKSPKTAINISDEEKKDLIFLREEEKLAHDVYSYSLKKYDAIIFSNISQSESNHMSQVLNLLDKYQIEDPAKSHAEGIFTNQILQKLYQQFISKSDSGIVQALEVGAMIEDLDLHDIETFHLHTNKPDIKSVYDRLSCGSRNHLRSFVRNLNDYNKTYAPHYILTEEYNTIIQSKNTPCGQALRGKL